MANELARREDAPLGLDKPEPNWEVLERVVVGGDLSKLSPQEKLSYYKGLCDSLNLNPHTRPFEYMRLNNKETLYPTKNCADQLRKNNRISLEIVSRQQEGDLYIVSVRATTPDGRTDEDEGAVSIKGLGGEALANARMKAVTKGKRRVTYSICGLSWPDESEVDSIPGAQRTTARVPSAGVTKRLPSGGLVDESTGEVHEGEVVEEPAQAPSAKQSRAKRVEMPSDEAREKFRKMLGRAESLGIMIAFLNDSEADTALYRLMLDCHETETPLVEYDFSQWSKSDLSDAGKRLQQLLVEEKERIEARKADAADPFVNEEK